MAENGANTDRVCYWIIGHMHVELPLVLLHCALVWYAWLPVSNEWMKAVRLLLGCKVCFSI